MDNAVWGRQLKVWLKLTIVGLVLVTAAAWGTGWPPWTFLACAIAIGAVPLSVAASLPWAARYGFFQGILGLVANLTGGCMLLLATVARPSFSPLQWVGVSIFAAVVASAAALYLLYHLLCRVGLFDEADTQPSDE